MSAIPSEMEKYIVDPKQFFADLKRLVEDDIDSDAWKDIEDEMMTLLREKGERAKVRQPVKPEERCMARVAKAGLPCQCSRRRAKDQELCSTHYKKETEYATPGCFTEDGKPHGLFYGRFNGVLPVIRDGFIVMTWKTEEVKKQLEEAKKNGVPFHPSSKEMKTKARTASSQKKGKEPKEKKEKVDPSLSTKKPIGSFMRYQKDIREELISEGFIGKEIAKEAGRRWREDLTEAEKKPYADQFRREMELWTQRFGVAKKTSSLPATQLISDDDIIMDEVQPPQQTSASSNQTNVADTVEDEFTQLEESMSQLDSKLATVEVEDNGDESEEDEEEKEEFTPLFSYNGVWYYMEPSTNNIYLADKNNEIQEETFGILKGDKVMRMNGQLFGTLVKGKFTKFPETVVKPKLSMGSTR
jgi:hypothetical protein